MCVFSLFWKLGMVASLTPLPVIGVPVRATRLDGVDSLLSIVQVHASVASWFTFVLSIIQTFYILFMVLQKMPRGVPVATVAINNSTNAALLAIRMLGISDTDLVSRF